MPIVKYREKVEAIETKADPTKRKTSKKKSVKKPRKTTTSKTTQNQEIKKDIPILEQPQKVVEVEVEEIEENSPKIRKRENIKTEVVKNLKKLGLYKLEYKNTIARYVDMQYEYEILYAQRVDEGFRTEEEYTNKAGAVNTRKPPSLAAIEKLRLDLVSYENVLGLTPKALQTINQFTPKGKKTSKLANLIGGGI